MILVALATWSAETPSFLSALALRAALVKRILYAPGFLDQGPSRGNGLSRLCRGLPLPSLLPSGFTSQPLSASAFSVPGISAHHSAAYRSVVPCDVSCDVPRCQSSETGDLPPLIPAQLVCTCPPAKLASTRGTDQLRVGMLITVHSIHVSLRVKPSNLRGESRLKTNTLNLCNSLK